CIAITVQASGPTTTDRRTSWWRAFTSATQKLATLILLLMVRLVRGAQLLLACASIKVTTSSSLEMISITAATVCTLHGTERADGVLPTSMSCGRAITSTTTVLPTLPAPTRCISKPGARWYSSTGWTATRTEVSVQT